MSYDHIPFIIGGVLVIAAGIAVWTTLRARKRKREEEQARRAQQARDYWAAVEAERKRKAAHRAQTTMNAIVRPYEARVSRSRTKSQPRRQSASSGYARPSDTYFDPTPAIITAAILSTPDTSSYSAPSYDSGSSSSFDSGSFSGGDSGSF